MLRYNNGITSSIVYDNTLVFCCCCILFNIIRVVFRCYAFLSWAISTLIWFLLPWYTLPRKKAAEVERGTMSSFVIKWRKLVRKQSFFLLRLPVCYSCSNFICFQIQLFRFSSCPSLAWKGNVYEWLEYSLWLSSLCKELPKSIAFIVQMHFMP